MKIKTAQNFRKLKPIQDKDWSVEQDRKQILRVFGKAAFDVAVFLVGTALLISAWLLGMGGQ